MELRAILRFIVCILYKCMSQILCRRTIRTLCRQSGARHPTAEHYAAENYAEEHYAAQHHARRYYIVV